MGGPPLDPYTVAFWRPIQAQELALEQEIAEALDQWGRPGIGQWLKHRCTSRLLAVLDHVVMLERRVIGAMEAKDATTFRAQRIEWAQTQGAAMVRRITDAQRAAIRSAVSAGTTAGRGEILVGRDIARDAGLPRSRAEMIARTELHNAATYAAEQEARAAVRRGANLVKVWTAAMDARTRLTHRKANGQVRAMDEAFVVGGARMMRPGDPRGPAREVIRCRCVARHMPRMQIGDDRQRRAVVFVDWAVRQAEPAQALGRMLTEMDPMLARVVRREAERRRITPIAPIAPVPGLSAGVSAEEGEDGET